MSRESTHSPDAALDGVASLDRDAIVTTILTWYAENARVLPWRLPTTTPWGVMVSEFMLQQTPVSRVLEPWAAWLERWPTPDSLAAATSGDAVRAWGRLGYPRRAQRLHAAAVTIRERHGGRVPDRVDELRTLPGVGEYTAAAITSFAYGRREVVLDTNVRRLLARLDGGLAHPPATLTADERRRATDWLPHEPARAARWAVASMELGAQLCRAASPACSDCPVRQHCAWLAAGRPPASEARRVQPWAGTDRQCRGRLLATVRESGTPRTDAELFASWAVDPEQADRCLAALLDEGLLRRTDDGRLDL